MASSEWIVSAEAGPPWLCGFVGPASPSGFDTMVSVGAVLGLTKDCWLRPFCFDSEGKTVGACFSESGTLQMAVGAFVLGLLLPLMLAVCRLDTTL